MQQSEVARVREQIDMEIAAMNLALRGFAVVAPHRVIQAHMTRLGGHAERLIAAIGPEQALPELVEKMDQVRPVEAPRTEGSVSSGGSSPSQNTVLAVPPPAQPEEPRLRYDQATQCWSGQDQLMWLWMEDTTFQTYLRAYEEGTYGPQATPLQQQAAFQHCQRVAYWHGCEGNRDPNVHVHKKC